MRWDYSLGHQAEDRWAEMRTAAEEQRRLKQLQSDEERSAGHGDGLSRGRTIGLGGRLRRWAQGIAGFFTLVLVLLVAHAGAQGITEMARNLAENVLGPGSVKAVRLAGDGQTLHLRWDSATFRQGLPAREARDQIYGEAELATGSVLGRLISLSEIRFTILSKNSILAVGANRRGEGMTIIFAPSLRGGTMKPAPPNPTPGNSSARPLGGGTSAKSW